MGRGGGAPHGSSRPAARSGGGGHPPRFGHRGPPRGSHYSHGR